MNKKLILIILGVVIIAIVGVFSAYLVLQPQYEIYENEYFSVNVTKGYADFTSNITENNSVTTYEYTNGDKQDEGYVKIGIISVNNSGNLFKLVASSAMGKIEDDWAPY